MKTLFLQLMIMFSCSVLSNENQEKELKNVIKLFEKVETKISLNSNLKPCENSIILSKNKIISDSFVLNLSCDKLTRENIFLNLQPDAFSKDKEWKSINWTSSNLGQCWAFALSQRRLFYLARFKSKNAEYSFSDESRNQILKMINTKKPQSIIQLDIPKITSKEWDQAFKREPPETKIVDVMESLSSEKDGRNFRSEMESLQKKRFYSFSNISLLMGSGERSQSQNIETFEKIQENLKQGRLPILILRSSIASQHVVLVKKIEKISSNEFNIIAYDSSGVLNTGEDVDAVINFKDNRFQYNFNYVGTFIKDEDDMDEIQNLTYKYYKDLCDNG